MRENFKEFKLDLFFTLIRRKIQRIDTIVLLRTNKEGRDKKNYDF